MQRVGAFRASFLSAEVAAVRGLLRASTSDGGFDREVPDNAVK